MSGKVGVSSRINIRAYGRRLMHDAMVLARKHGTVGFAGSDCEKKAHICCGRFAVGRVWLACSLGVKIGWFELQNPEI